MKFKRLLKPSLLKKFLLAFFIVTMIPLSIAEYFTMKKVEEELKSVLNEEYYLIIDQLRRTVDEVFIGNWLTNLTSLAGYLERDPYLSDELRNALMDAKLNQINESVILALKMSDMEQPFFFMKSELITELYGKDPENVAELFQFTGEAYTGEITSSTKSPIYLKNSQKLLLPIEFPIEWENGQTAVIRGVFDLNTILDYISTEISIGARELYIVNKDEQVVFSSKNAKFASGDTLPYPIMTKVKNSLTGEARIFQIEQFSYGGEKYLGNFTISQYVKWGIVVADKYSRAYAMVDQARRDIIKWIGIAILLCIIFSVFFARSFSSAMRYLADIAKKIGSGEFDIKVKVKSKDEMGQLGISLQEMAVSLKDAVQVKEELFAIQAEVEIASRIQQSILPVGGPDLKGLEFGARYIPMEGVAGDFYDFHVLSEHTVGVLVADVSGHGIPAAMISTMVKVTFSQQSSIGDDASNVLNEMNRLLSGKMEDQFLTAAYVYLDLKKKILITADAGHCPLLIWRRKTKEILRVKPKGMIIGFMPEINCPIEEMKIKDGDRIVMYTDGIIEAANPDGELYNEPRFMDLIRENQDSAPEDFIDTVVDTLKKWVGENKKTFEDDLTMVVMDIGKN
ncbi:MAG: SpoIIE family protein phosphatase [Candidatus Marinimicrobia bacterium]|nr:SpoIIE family protein phosphatase [Candidatus Neomarinimicrobiota bacterium]